MKETQSSRVSFFIRYAIDDRTAGRHLLSRLDANLANLNLAKAFAGCLRLDASLRKVWRNEA